jgi:hypothetical protein
LPGLPRGRCGLSAFQASSDSQNKLFAMTIALQRLKSGVNIQSKSINYMGTQPRPGRVFADTRHRLEDIVSRLDAAAPGPGKVSTTSRRNRASPTPQLW